MIYTWYITFLSDGERPVTMPSINARRHSCTNACS